MEMKYFYCCWHQQHLYGHEEEDVCGCDEKMLKRVEMEKFKCIK